MNKKILALCLVVVLAVTAVTGATLAYFTDTTEVVKNTFSVGKVEIDLDEAKTAEDGKAPDHDDRVKANTYTDLNPAQTVDKDPTVTVKGGSENCYVRMIVTVDNEKLTTAFPADAERYDGYYAGDVFLLQNVVAGWDNTVWVPHSAEIKDGVATYEFWYYGEKADDKGMIAESTDATVLEDLFTEVTIPAQATNTDMKNLDGIQINIVAHAIQADGFADQAAAWAAWVAEDAVAG